MLTKWTKGFFHWAGSLVFQDIFQENDGTTYLNHLVAPSFFTPKGAQVRCRAVISNTTFLGRLVWAEKQPSFLKDEY